MSTNQKPADQRNRHDPAYGHGAVTAAATQVPAHTHDHDHSTCGHDHSHDHDHSHAAPVQTIRRAGPKVGRNDPCSCGSNQKYKKCCGA